LKLAADEPRHAHVGLLVVEVDHPAIAARRARYRGDPFSGRAGPRDLRTGWSGPFVGQSLVRNIECGSHPLWRPPSVVGCG
jgi:hypothetical protein